MKIDKEFEYVQEDFEISRDHLRMALLEYFLKHPMLSPFEPNEDIVTLDDVTVNEEGSYTVTCTVEREAYSEYPAYEDYARELGISGETYD